MREQIPLFDVEPANTPDSSAESVARVHEEARLIAADLPADIRFGTSSWSFPGWKGIVFAGPVTAAAIAKDGLRQYARHPLLRTVGIDRSYYAPIPIEDLRRYADQLPDGFRGCAKAPASVTSAARHSSSTTFKLASRRMTCSSHPRGLKWTPKRKSVASFLEKSSRL